MGTMDVNQFKSFVLRDDPYENEVAQLRLDDLKPKYNGKIRLSYMISTYNRGAQLSRSLETLARQTFRAFEVLINDSDSSQDIEAICKRFRPYLNIQYHHTKRDQWLMCPSHGFKKMLPFCNGDVIAIAHPEIMLDNDAVEILYYQSDPVNRSDLVRYSHLDNYDLEEPKLSDWVWVTFKARFLDTRTYPIMDRVDWHTKTSNLQGLPGFWESTGLSNQSNSMWAQRFRHPWWFVASVKKECPIWEAMPVFQGHAMIDMWMIKYRHEHNFVDATPLNSVCYHQDHFRMAAGPKDEPEVKVYE